jgi:hypothetical protein
MKERLNPKIIEKLKRKLGQKENIIRVRISQIRHKYPYLTLNAAAYLLAKKRGISVAGLLSETDRKSLKDMEEVNIIKVDKKKKEKVKNKRIIEIAKYETDDKFLMAHINEINKTYTYGCYTACFILMRKVLENLIIEILKKKYPDDKEKYFDTGRGRYHDFNKLLENLKESSKDFSTEKDIIKRIYELAQPFREQANEMTHSLYHIAKKKEIDESKYQEILDLISQLFQKHFTKQEVKI